jgi:adenylate kinase
MRLILLGPPGAGKGSQATLLSQALEVPHISTGDIFRANIKDKTELGMRVKSILDSGGLVPDDLTMEIVRDRLSREDCRNGFIMDGFPRTIPQAEMFGEMLREGGQSLDAVINLVVSDDVIVKRMSGRRMCRCGAVYHLVSNPPRVEGICDSCGAPLFIREDDREETVLKRLETYHRQTSPLIDYYGKLGLVMDFDGVKRIEEAFSDIMKALDEIKGSR